MTTVVPPATWKILPPATTDPPAPTPTTTHPTWAVTVWPALTVNVLEALTGTVKVPVEFRAVVELPVVVAGGAVDLGILVDAGKDLEEIDDFGFLWFVVLVLTGVFGLAVG